MTANSAKSEGLGTVQRVVEILRFVADHGHFTLKELSAALGLAPSTCHRLLELLARDGLIARDATRRDYAIGGELFRISALIHAKHDIRETARPFLERVVAASDETCVLGLYLPKAKRMVFADKVDSTRLLRYQLQMNTPLSVLWGASGRAMLAFLAKADIDSVYALEGSAPASGEPLPPRSSLERELAKIRREGYAISHGQKVSGAVGITAPVFGPAGLVIGSLGVTVPQERMKRTDEARLAKLVTVAGFDLSSALGAPATKKGHAA